MKNYLNEIYYLTDCETASSARFL